MHRPAVVIRQSDRWETQNEMIAEFLRRGCSITPKEAYEYFGCMRLSARIHNLRNEYSHLVSDGRRIESETVQQDGKQFARYYLVDIDEN